MRTLMWAAAFPLPVVPRFLLPCVEGIEPECAADAVDLGARSPTGMFGRVLVEADEDFLYRANLAHPTANRVLQVVAEGDVSSPEDVARLVQDVPWEDFFGLDRSFAGDCVRVGEHPFTSVDVAKAVGDGVCARFRAVTNGAARPPVDLRRPDVTVVAHVRGERAYVCVDTTGATLHQRPWRVYNPEAPLPATLASALVRRSGWTEGLLLDPMCGSGTIPIEADLRARRRAVNLARPRFAFQRLRTFDAARFEGVRDELACAARDERPPILGNDLWAKNVEGARRNAQQAGAEIAFSQGDLDRLPRPEGMTTLVANPPWGLRLAGRKASDRICARLRARMQGWAEEGPYVAVVIVGNGRFQQEPPPPDEIQDALVGGITCRVLTYRF